MSINIVENLGYTNKVVKGAGICAGISAILYKHIENLERLTPQVYWKTLLYSGPDDNMLFITQRKRYAAKTKQTSTGTFKTICVGNLEMMFPAFSNIICVSKHSR